MHFLELLLIALALGTDAFAVTLANGLAFSGDRLGKRMAMPVGMVTRPPGATVSGSSSRAQRSIPALPAVERVGILARGSSFLIFRVIRFFLSLPMDFYFMENVLRENGGKPRDIYSTPRRYRPRVKLSGGGDPSRWRRSRAEASSGVSVVK